MKIKFPSNPFQNRERLQLNSRKPHEIKPGPSEAQTDLLEKAQASFGTEGRSVVAALQAGAKKRGATLTSSEVDGRLTFFVKIRSNPASVLTHVEVATIVSEAARASSAWEPVLAGTQLDEGFAIELHVAGQNSVHGLFERSTKSQLNTGLQAPVYAPQRPVVDVREAWEKNLGGHRYPDPGVLTCKNIDEVAQACGVAPAKLEEHLRERITKWADELKTALSTDGPKVFPLIDALYNLHMLSETPPAPWIASLRTFDAFVDHFCPDATAHSKAYVIRNIEAFVANQIQFPRFRGDLWWDKEIKPTYMGAGNWVPLENYDTVRWVDQSVIDEVKSWDISTYPRRDDSLNHGTGSEALSGIAKAGAILSAYEAKQRTLAIKTGEHVSYIGHNDVPVAGGKSGLGSVYTAKGALAFGGYHVTRWFDEFPVTFCIDRNKRASLQKEKGYRVPLADFGSEGILVGSEVPLSNVTAVSTPKIYEPKIRAWLAAHCPHVAYVSMEAAQLIEASRAYRT